MTGSWSLLRRAAIASAVLVLGVAPPALAASSAPRNAAPDPSPTPIPDPYPGIARTRPAPVHVVEPTRTLPVRPAPVTPAPVIRTPVTEPATVPQRTVVHHTVRVHHKTRPVHRVRHVVVRVPVAVTAPPPVRIRRPDPPAPSVGSWIFGSVVHTRTGVPDQAALAVALVVLLSGLFLARTARELAR